MTNNFIRIKNIYVNLYLVERISVDKNYMFFHFKNNIINFSREGYEGKFTVATLTDEEFKKLKDFVDCMEQQIVIP